VEALLRAAVVSLFAVLLSVAFCQSANGLQNDLIGLRADAAAFSTMTIGLMMASYYVGFSAAALSGHLTVGRIGQLRAMALCLLASAAIILLHPLLIVPVVWTALRFASGFVMSLFDVGVESWINEKSENAVRGRVFSIYMMVQIATMTLAQYILSLGNPRTMGLFLVAAILFILGTLPLRLTTHNAPKKILPRPLSLKQLFMATPLGAAGVFIAGMGWAVVFTFGPIFARRAGFDLAGVGLFMGLAMGGGAILQFPSGWLSDWVGRRPVIGGLFVFGLGAALFGMWATGQGGAADFLATALTGGFVFPIYAVAAARMNDVVTPSDRVSAAAGLLLLFGLGSIVGPLLCGWAMQGIGLGGYYAVLATAMAAGVVLTVRWR
jgi:MFS family permease